MKYKPLAAKFLLRLREDVGELLRQLLKDTEKKDEFISEKTITHNPI
jgi:hypothetical protein